MTKWTKTLVHDAKVANVGGFQVRRALPRLGMRTVGEWGFVDRFGPEIVTETSGLNAVFLGGEPLCVWWSSWATHATRSRRRRCWEGYVDTGTQESAERFDRVTSTLAPIAAPALI